ncbi:MAG: protein-methionine-sulfoxide reductase heme-binding subunit MsrQ [Anaerolineae bacterium]
MVLLEKFRANWLRLIVHIGALLPLAWLAWRYTQGLFLIDPVREITTITGQGALILLVLSLACTPISTLTGWKHVTRVRRALGVYAFVYAGLHFLTFAGLDYGFDLELLQQAIFDQWFVLLGLASGLLLLALAATSTRGWQKRLGRTWKRLHRLVYLAGILAVTHFFWLDKDLGDPLPYGVILAALFILRIPSIRRAVSTTRRQLLTKLRGSIRAATPGS